MSSAFGAGDTVASAGANYGTGKSDTRLMWGTTISFDQLMDITTYERTPLVR